ncbi:MAG: methyltransferase domain-containing protein [Nitrospira sp.]
MRYELTRSGFDGVMREFRPSRYEVFSNEDPRFTVPMHHALKCRDRLYVAIRSGLRWLPEGSNAVVDFGPYPGSLLRLMRLIEPTRSAKLVGAGLMAGAEFVQLMKQDVDVDILTVNLDPAAKQFAHKPYPATVPLHDGAARLVFALEIVEHLTSPFHLLAEAHRLLQPGGCLVVTTPNVTRIGNVLKLLAGRTLNDRLAPPGYDNPDDEWRPHVREYAMHELRDMLRGAGFEVVEARHFLGEDTQDCRQTVRQQTIDWVKWPFYAVPHLRGSLLMVGRKP